MKVPKFNPAKTDASITNITKLSWTHVLTELLILVKISRDREAKRRHPTGAISL